MKNMDDIRKIAHQCRIDILEMTSKKKASFIGSDYSCIDILSVLYANYINTDRDSFVMSKGHAACAWYAILANTGLIAKSKLEEFNISGKNMGVHPKRGALPYIKTSTGSLGQGVGLASGMALAEKLSGRDGRIYVLVGDGEMNEGSVWEALMFATKQELDNLILILDRNGLQSYGTDEAVLNVKNYDEKFNSFGWNTQSINGHVYEDIDNALKNTQMQKKKPHAIVAETVKGKGVKEFENNVLWHYKFPDGEIYDKALQELSL